MTYRGVRLTAQEPFSNEAEMRWRVDVGEGVVVDSWNAAIDLADGHTTSPTETRFACEWCGRYELPDHYSSKETLKKRRACFGCNFWLEYVERRDEPQLLRVEGNQFSVGDEKKSESWMRGHGGRQFRWRDLRTHDVRTSTNLWSAGKISERFRAMLPDNAEWC